MESVYLVVEPGEFSDRVITAFPTREEAVRAIEKMAAAGAISWDSDECYITYKKSSCRLLIQWVPFGQLRVNLEQLTRV